MVSVAADGTINHQPVVGAGGGDYHRLDRLSAQLLDPEAQNVLIEKDTQLVRRAHWKSDGRVYLHVNFFYPLMCIRWQTMCVCVQV